MRHQSNGGKKAEREMDAIAQAVRREVRALSRVRHPNVLRLYGACFDPSPMVVMAYAPSGTLQDAVDNGHFDGITAIARLLAGVARGLEAVHAHKIIHLDMKPENVLIGPNSVPWITDFGLSTSANMTSMSQSSAGGAHRASSGRPHRSSPLVRASLTVSASNRGAAVWEELLPQEARRNRIDATGRRGFRTLSRDRESSSTTASAGAAPRAATELRSKSQSLQVSSLLEKEPISTLTSGDH